MLLLLYSLCAAFLLLVLLYKRNEKVGYLCFSAAFLIPSLFLPVVVPGGVKSVSAGGSPLYNLLLIASQGLFLTVALFSIPEEPEPKPLRKFLNTEARSATLFFGLTLLLMQLISAYTSSPRVIPLITIFLFIFSIFIARQMSFEKFYDSIERVFFFIAVVVLLGILLRFEWGSVDQYSSLYESGVYFSPFGSVLGLPVRVAGPFGSAQDLGIFCSMGFALAIFNNVKSSLRVIFCSLIFIFLGSLTGSRTFYITILTAICLNIVYHLSKKYTSLYLPLAILGFVVVYIVVSELFLPTISSTSNVKEIGGRSLLWQTIFQHWSDNGLFGQGPNTLSAYMKARLGFWQYGHAHNSLLQYLWDFGILGAVSFTLFLISWIVTMASRKHGGLKQLCVFLTFMTIQSEISFEIDLRFKGLLVMFFYLALIDVRPFTSSTYKEEMNKDIATESHEK